MSAAKHGTKTSTMRLVEMTFCEPLEELLENWRAEGLNAPAIQRRLAANGVVVSTMTIRNWRNALGGSRPLLFEGDSPAKRGGRPRLRPPL